MTDEDKKLEDGLMKYLPSLEERERKILTLRYGLDGSEPMTFKRVGEEVSISTSRARDIASRAVRRLYSEQRREKRLVEMREEHKDDILLDDVPFDIYYRTWNTLHCKGIWTLKQLVTIPEEEMKYLLINDLYRFELQVDLLKNGLDFGMSKEDADKAIRKMKEKMA